MSPENKIKSVAIIGAGAAGAATAAAFKAENYFEKIRVFERRETPGGTWIYDASPQPSLAIRPGLLPPESDPRLEIPKELPSVTPPNRQERFALTPIYNSLTTNVPDIAMCFSDAPFAYGPFAPHYIPRQYVENYFSLHQTDSLLVLNTTLEDLTRLPPAEGQVGGDQWRLTLRKHDPVRDVDIWWQEIFDAVILANGHYSVPYVPQVKGLEEYVQVFPGRVAHSKYYRAPAIFRSKKVVVIGNSASGHDIAAELVSVAQAPVYVSRRSKSRWEGDEPPPGIAWKPTIREYLADSGRIVFDDGTHLDGVDAVIYCTGYKPSFPFWNTDANGGRPLWDYAADRLVGAYWHTFFRDFPTLAIVGLPRTLTFRSFEYQAVALARLFAGRNAAPLPPREEQERWERERAERTRREGKKFHDVPWDDGQTFEYLERLFRIAGLGTLKGEGRVPPALGEDIIWAIEHVRKYPEPGRSDEESAKVTGGGQRKSEGQFDRDRREVEEGEWVVVERGRKDLLAFI